MKYYLSLLLVISVLYTNAQTENPETKETPKDTAWTFEGQSSFNFTQGKLENWSQGGEDFFSALFLNDYSIAWEKNRAAWDNTFTYKLGGTQQGGKKETIKKTEDIFEFNSKFGYELSNKNLFFSNAISLKTQLLEGYDYQTSEDSAISSFMTPGYIVIASGFEYKYKKILSAMVSPISGKATIVNDTIHSQSFGLEAGENFRAEMGAYIKILFKKEILKNVKLTSSLELFNNYFEKPENIDVDWQTTINFNVNKYIKAVLFAHFMYDHDVIQKLQIKETIGIGISYAFNSKEKK